MVRIAQPAERLCKKPSLGCAGGKAQPPKSPLSGGLSTQFPPLIKGACHSIPPPLSRGLATQFPPPYQGGLATQFPPDKGARGVGNDEYWFFAQSRQ